MFARLAMPPFSEDELILAVSECTVLLQEGRDVSGHGAFGAWVRKEASLLVPEEDRAESLEILAQGPGGDADEQGGRH